MSDAAIALTPTALRAELSRQCESAGGQSAWARAHSIPVSQVSEALSGRRDLPDRIVNAMGFMRVARYIQVRRAREAA